VDSKYQVRFKNSDLGYLRGKLLEDLSREYFAVLLGKTEKINEYTIITVVDTIFLERSDYRKQSCTFLDIRKDFIHRVLVEVTSRYDVDTIVDVHTHPFSCDYVAFSGVDDRDEETFFSFLREHFDNVSYASIVFSQEQYSARVWVLENDHVVAKSALLKTQTRLESISSTVDDMPDDTTYEQAALQDKHGIFHRSALTLGLDVMRSIMGNQVVTIVGLGGLGSVIAEHIIHMGFHHVNLIDHDTLELSNMNRIVGAYYEDAIQNASKVDVVKRHLSAINPHAHINALRNNIYDKEVEQTIALSDWIVLATDNHSSRMKAQELSVQYFVPLISAGVNITVNNNTIEDMSGEVITTRVGDQLCLKCLKRINPIKVASEIHPEEMVRSELVNRGYVTGKDIKEPAVKTLNTLVATFAVEMLVNQYTGFREHVPILVYEGNVHMSVYQDYESVQRRNMQCDLCNI
jgi:molybdopterin/thiamine biosynthesis adenylyltransferase